MPTVQAILIIEDDLVDQMAFSRSLSKHYPSAKIVIAETVKDGIQQMENQKFDWVISDFNLPDGTVMDLLQYAETNKMVCISGETEANNIQLLMDRGFKKFLLKDQHLGYVKELLKLINFDPAESLINSSKAKASNSIDILLEKFDGDQSVVKDILQIFNEKGAGDLQQLAEALSNQDIDQSNHLAHRIKSGYRVIGLSTACDLLEQIELKSQESPIQWEHLNEELKKVQSIFEDYCKRIPTLLANLSTNA